MGKMQGYVYSHAASNQAMSAVPNSGTVSGHRKEIALCRI